MSVYGPIVKRGTVEYENQKYHVCKEVGMKQTFAFWSFKKQRGKTIKATRSAQVLFFMCL